MSSNIIYTTFIQSDMTQHLVDLCPVTLYVAYIQTASR